MTKHVTSLSSISNSTSYRLVWVDDACDSTYWPSSVNKPPTGTFWIIAWANSICSVGAKAALAINYGATGFIISSTSTFPADGSIPWYTPISAIGVSASVGTTLISAIKSGTNVLVGVNYHEQHTTVVVSNICGDTPGGDPHSTVMVGGHSDGVRAGPGTNDDGSGSTATLALAMGVTKLMNDGSYNLPNMIKFCWFGGEEDGLLGSIEVVRVGLLKNNDPNARAGSKAKDWAVMIDLDMLGSMNFMNYIYDANQYIPRSTPVSAFNGSQTMTNLFFDFFKQNNIPCDSDRFDGRSDYGPFLEVGIPAGGVDAGSDKRKNERTRLRYQEMTGWGGIANAYLDQCYHKACDTIANIHWGVYTNMTMSAAYVLEKFATRENLREWINYPMNEQMPDPRGHVAFDLRSRPSHHKTFEQEQEEIY